MVDSLDELKSSRSVNGKYFPDFEMLDAKIAIALNNVIQNSQFKEKGRPRGSRKPPKRGSVSTRETDRLHNLRLFQLISVTLRDDNIQEFDTRWNDVLLSMSKNPSDDISENLYKFRIRESDHLKTVLELYDMEIHQKMSVPNYQKLKTMVNRSIDQKLRLRNFDARHGRIESGAVIKSRKGLSSVEGGSQGRTSRGNPMQNVLEPIQRVRFTRSTLREKEGTMVGTNKCLHQRSPYAMIFEDRKRKDHRTTAAMCPKQGWNLAKRKEKEKAVFYFPAEEWVLPAASTKEPEESEFVFDSGSSVHMVSKKDLNSAEFGDHEDIEESDDGDDGQRSGANQRRSDGICQAIGLIRQSYVS